MKRPDPPHISASIYTPEQTDDTTLAQVYTATVTNLKATEISRDVAPSHLQFDAVSDLANDISNVKIDDGSQSTFSSVRVVQHYLSSPLVGPLIVKFERAPASDNHPVSVIWGSGTLGLPLDLLNNTDRREAEQSGRRSTEFFQFLCEYCDPLYGQLAIEETLYSPSDIFAGGWNIGDSAYISNRLLNAVHPHLRKQLLAGINQVSSAWSTGTYASSWQTFNARDIGEEDGLRSVSDVVTQILTAGLRTFE